MTQNHTNGRDDAEKGGEVRRILEDLAARNLDASAVAFHIGIDRSAIYRWAKAEHVTAAALTALRLFSALHRVCPEAALAARVDSEESWAELVGGLQRTHKAAWSQQGRGVHRDGADDARGRR